jgi:hypothetical protein
MPINKPFEPDDYSNITAENAVENSPAFLNAANDAWADTLMRSTRGNPTEAGFTVNRAGQPSKVTSHSGYEGNGNAGMSQQISDDTIAAIHTHPDEAAPGPSSADIEAAKKTGKPLMVESRGGLYEVDAQGTVRQVEKGTDWLTKKTSKKSGENKKVSQQTKTTDIDSHEDGSHSVYHHDKNGDLVASYAVSSLAGLKNGLNKYLGQKNG